MPGRMKRAERERLQRDRQTTSSAPMRPTGGLRILATCPMCGLRAPVFPDASRPPDRPLPNLRFPYYEVQVFRQTFGGVKGAKGTEARGSIVHEPIDGASVPMMKALLVNMEYVGRVLIDSLNESGLNLPPDIHQAAHQLGDVLAVWGEVAAVTAVQD